MLNKRAQILFDVKTYKTLEEIAQEKKSSVGELVRTAVKKTYEDKSKTKKPYSLAEAAKETFGAWKAHPSTDRKLMNSLSGPWSKPDEIFEKT
ncbi:MAG: hypothetical protein A2126_01890 [Candidatus Woykebacteria bacterium GWB1_45_5]|uniref:Ribbon-helix-helix protein CopG domain-containing protein n=2 Tax=Candidatus Woykeibacteriota TaxID=1817899 RepID=A0A1G1W202_9BACT|nr:MAG: hypothetical protein A2113_03850 [Candidatus Woykebacteria bacterium GWA1_44_8]OGY23048.1 MAG: hypothetical protein A2126_01890 [Candidatus Woykebacteria bacterium GWB1_45_5]